MKKFLLRQKHVVLVLGVFAFAFAILLVSILQSSAITYSLAPPVSPSIPGQTTSEINYQFPSEGKVLPDNPLWTLKALRDRIWYLITPSPLKRAELALLFSDKRLVSAQTLFEKKKPGIAISTLTKGEKYLEVAATEEKIARAQGYKTYGFLTKLATASLKHRQVIENLMSIVPDDGRPQVEKAENYSKSTYKAAKDALNSMGMPVPINPFGGD